MVRTVFGVPETSTTLTVARMPALLPTTISLIPSNTPGVQVDPT